MQLSGRFLFAGLWLYGFLVYFLFFKLFVWLAYSGASPPLPVTHPLVGTGMGVVGGLYFALTLHGLRPRPGATGSSALVSGGCVAILASFLTFVTISVVFALGFVLLQSNQFSSSFFAFPTACISFGGAVFSVWFLYSIPFNFAFGTLARKVLSCSGQ